MSHNLGIQILHPCNSDWSFNFFPSAKIAINLGLQTVRVLGCGIIKVTRAAARTRVASLTLAFISRQKSEIVGEISSLALKMQFVRFYRNIRKYMCKYKHSLTKLETFHIVAVLNGTNCQLADYKY